MNTTELMIRFRLLPLLAVLLAGVAFTGAPADPSAETALEAIVQDFLAADSGFTVIDPDQLEADIADTLPDSGSVFLASGRLSPLAKAVHAVNVHDGSLERVRWELSVERVLTAQPPAADPVPLLLVKVTRFNLGPVLRQQLLDSLPPEQVAGPEEFGVGPHVEWRVIVRQLMGHEAMIEAASRREVADAEAAAAACLFGDCLSSGLLIDGAAVWHDLAAADPGFTVAEFLAGLAYDAAPAGTPSAAAALDLAAALTGFDAYYAESGSPDATVVRASVEQNLGQEASLDAALLQTDLLDDSLETIITRVYGWDTGESFPLLGAQAYGCRRGDAQWAPVGDFCP